MNSYSRIYNFILETRRMTRKELQDVATEVHGTADNPSRITTAGGFTPKRTKREVRRAETRGAQPMSRETVQGMSSAGEAQKIKPGIVGKARLMGRALLQWRKRGHLQNIPKMIKTMKRDPGEFPAAVSFTADPRTKGEPGHRSEARPTAVTGRTRMAVASATGKEAEGITLPASRYAGSAERHEKWVKSGGRATLAKSLAKKGRRLRGQDPRTLPK